MPSAPPCSSVDSNSSCMPMHTPITGTPAATRSRSSSSSPSGARAPSPSASPPRPAAPRVRRAHALVVRGQLGPGADVLERLVDRAQVAHPVVEDRDVLTEPLGGGHPLTPRVHRRSPAQRPREGLEGHLDHVVGVRARPPQVQRQLGRVGHGAEELLREVGVEVATTALGGISPSNAVNGRPEMSIAHEARASSMGTTALPKRAMPARSPRAWSSACRARCRCPPPCGAARSRDRR